MFFLLLLHDYFNICLIESCHGAGQLVGYYHDYKTAVNVVVFFVAPVFRQTCCYLRFWFLFLFTNFVNAMADENSEYFLKDCCSVTSVYQQQLISFKVKKTVT